ncbi:MAG: YlbF family regulator [Verrucomicrobia bacterium]|nr:YlbF family regulator [Verrucomicrobiota bacterium]
MQAIAEESAVIQKTRELCQTLLDQPDVQSMRQRIDAFVADDRAKAQYDALMVKGQSLQQKQQLGTALSNDEIADFEKHREAFVNNPVAKGFLDAQEEMNQLQQSLGQYVTKTFELGRVPGPEDFDSGSCGHGCGCHH